MVQGLHLMRHAFTKNEGHRQFCEHCNRLAMSSTMDETCYGDRALIEAFTIAMIGRQYGQQEQRDALSWFASGWKARQP